MNWLVVAPGGILLLVKLTGTSLFLLFLPQIFPRGNISLVPEDKETGPQATKSPSDISAAFPATATRPSNGRVPSPGHWDFYGGHSYWFSEDTLQMIASGSDCKHRNAALVMINDKEELAFLQNKTTAAAYFIGLAYDEMEEKWLWSDDSEPRRDLFPMLTNQEGKECAVIRAGDVRPEFCHESRRWICETMSNRPAN